MPHLLIDGIAPNLEQLHPIEQRGCDALNLPHNYDKCHKYKCKYKCKHKYRYK